MLHGLSGFGSSGGLRWKYDLCFQLLFEHLHPERNNKSVQLDVRPSKRNRVIAAAVDRSLLVRLVRFSKLCLEVQRLLRFFVPIHERDDHQLDIGDGL